MVSTSQVSSNFARICWRCPAACRFANRFVRTGNAYAHSAVCTGRRTVNYLFTIISYAFLTHSAFSSQTHPLAGTYLYETRSGPSLACSGWLTCSSSRGGALCCTSGNRAVKRHYSRNTPIFVCAPFLAGRSVWSPRSPSSIFVVFIAFAFFSFRVFNPYSWAHPHSQSRFCGQNPPWAKSGSGGTGMSSCSGWCSSISHNPAYRITNPLLSCSSYSSGGHAFHSSISFPHGNPHSSSLHFCSFFRRSAWRFDVVDRGLD